MARPLHKKAHENCPHANWGECDKATTAAYTDWQAMQQVILAYNVVVGGRAGAFRKEESAFAQLVKLIAGEREDIMNDDGNPSQSVFVIRLRDAIERFKAGDLPVYNLVEPVRPAESEVT